MNILSIEGIPEELNVHLKNFGKDASEVDYDSIGPCPFCNSRIDEFNFCGCEIELIRLFSINDHYMNAFRITNSTVLDAVKVLPKVFHHHVWKNECSLMWLEYRHSILN